MHSTIDVIRATYYSAGTIGWYDVSMTLQYYAANIEHMCVLVLATLWQIINFTT